MHVAYLCCFQMIRSCWRANWKKRTWSCQTTRPPRRADTSRPQQTTRPPCRGRGLNNFTSSTWPSLDHATVPGSRVSPSPPLDYILDGELHSLLHSTLNQTFELKEEKKTPSHHSTSHSSTWVEYSS